MILFFVSCAGLVILGAAFYLWPVKVSDDEARQLAEANLRWYRLREQELARDGDEQLKEDIRLRLLEDEARITEAAAGDHEAVVTDAAGFPAWMLLPAMGVASLVLYYLLGASADVQITQRLQDFSADTAQENIAQLMADMEARSERRPDNLHYMALLGRFHMGREDYASALSVYERLLAQVPEDGQALAFASQAEYLSAGRTLTDRARLRAEQALAADPHQRTALSLLGMASFEQKQYRAAIGYWQRLKATEPVNSDSARMIESVIAQAQQQLGETPTGGTPSRNSGAESPAVESALGVTVRVELPDGADIAPADTVFILARSAQSQSRMPIAVKRLTGRDLPVTLRLDDSLSMAGQKLSEAESVIVAVQVSADGRPGEASAKWLGTLGPIAPSASEEPLLITLKANPGR